MSPESQLLFYCSRPTLRDSHIQLLSQLCQTNELDWQLIFATAERHGITPLVYTNLKQLSLSDLHFSSEMRTRFEQALFRNVAAKGYLLQKLTDALAFLNAKDVPVMAIKGAALDLIAYEQPWYTISGDIDLVLKPRVEALPQSDYQEIAHFFWNFPGCEYDFFEHHDITINGIVPVDFGQIWEDAIEIDFRQHRIQIMSPEDRLIAACINSCRKRYFRLKSLADIAVLIEGNSGINWDRLVAKSRSYGCSAIVYTALFIAKQVMDVQLPEGLLSRLRPTLPQAITIRWLSRRLRRVLDPGFKTEHVLFGRTIDQTLLLAYASYTFSQLWHKVNYAWKTRKQPPKGPSIRFVGKAG